MIFLQLYFTNGREKEKELTFTEQIRLIHKAGLEGKSDSYVNGKDDVKDIASLRERIKVILNITERSKIEAGNMLYFIMYDIENNKVRTLISKYLEKKGCQRVQKSIFFAETPRNIYNQIVKDLKEVQETYDNHDSIFMVPVSTDQVRAMKIIGQNIDFDIVVKNKNTLFF
jgi:CRISPR-associated protein Cas2